ncbi:MAG TPA: DNA-processing protein DprA [Solirubrobacterales bacterium]|nr:DNA-processing protein DprA [Solirubrobacterales bacterium]
MTHAGACPDCLRRAWLLSLAGPYIERTLVNDPGRSVFDILRLSNEALVERVAPEVAASLLARIEALPEHYFADALRVAECWATCRHDPFFPESAEEAPGASGALIGVGDPRHLVSFEWSQTATLVGARRATSYGREMAHALGADLAASGVTVVSGLDFGIGGCAHRGAVEAGRTIAVLPCGPDVTFPAVHRGLWKKIAERGLVLSELPPGATPWCWSVPARSRIMAALAGMTVVVEAHEGSGSLLTAELARRLGNEVGAVPGQATSRCSVGTNALLDEGAHVVRGADDVLGVLRGSARGAKSSVGGRS